MDMEQARTNMLERQIHPWGVHDERVLTLMGTLPREDFVPAPWRQQAFADMEIPLREDATALAAGCVMLPPRVQARMLQELRLDGHGKVLHIGTGSGFMAALLGRMAQRVISAELDAELAHCAQENLRRACVMNVQVCTGDGLYIAHSEGPFDAIVLSGAVTTVPDALIGQLNPGGRLFALVGAAPVMRATLLQRDASGVIFTQPWDATVPMLRGALAPENLAA
ncbi:MAG: protein-L-isoaspartate O-methyltransferase [Ottowia sp.]|nr:protein-L-isoaspartate O-methyltransferase [Ottowia sp.]